jgi:hypothetical protein
MTEETGAPAESAPADAPVTATRQRYTMVFVTYLLVSDFVIELGSLFASGSL